MRKTFISFNKILIKLELVSLDLEAQHFFEQNYFLS